MPPFDRLTRVGLCATCLHVRTITTGRGSTFYQCRMAWRDERFAKYPALPITCCAGYEPRPVAKPDDLAAEPDPADRGTTAPETLD